MIKSRRARLTGRVARVDYVKFIQNLTKRKGVRPLRIHRPRYRWEGNNEMICRDFWFGAVDFMRLAQDTVHW
jgi:hypothetical protein